MQPYYRPEDISEELAYTADIHDLVIPINSSGSCDSSADLKQQQPEQREQQHREEEGGVRVSVSDVVGKCNVVIPGPQEQPQQQPGR